MIYCLNFVNKNLEVFLNRHPHVREIQLARVKIRADIRITPACAGNTLIFDSIIKSTKDHPRMCGKYWLLLPARLYKVGSPPHVREILDNHSIVRMTYRITPACAGNTSITLIRPKTTEDHPRMCGKYTKRSIYDATCNLRIPFFHSLLNFQFIS